jgi:hypothetical protein
MAVPISTRQMALTRDVAPGGFMERFQVLLARVATTVLGEQGSTPYHPGRAQYAQTVNRNPVQAATAGGPIIVMGINIINTTTYDEATLTATCTATDPELESQITTFWNALAGLDTPS